MRKELFSFIILILSLITSINGQNLGIGPDTFDPDASAGVEMRFTNKGLLIPRLTLAQRNAIASPATSLLIYQTDNTPGYYYNAGTPASPNWVRLATTGLDGSGVATRVAFWSGANTLSSNANLYWDNTNNRLGVGTTSPSYNLHVQNTGGASSAKIGYTSSYTDNRLFFGDGSYVYVGEYNADDRLYLRGTTISIDINGSLGSNGQVLKSNGTTVSWGDVSGGGVSGSGTQNFIPKWTSSSSLGNSLLYDNGTTVQIGSTTLTNSKLGILNSGYIYGLYISSCGTGIYASGTCSGYNGIIGEGYTAGVDGRNSQKTNISGKLGYYDGSYYYGVYGETDNYAAVYGKNTSTSDYYGVYGICANQAYYGYGGYFKGGWKGVHGDASMSGSGSRYGVYGYASGGESSNYGVYYSGGLGGSGTKSAIVLTEEGPKAVYCQESPENWFEDFGKAKIYDGKAIVNIAKDFLMTVTINDEYPMNVFITPNADLGGKWWVEESIDHFTLYAPDAIDGAGFTYRVVAKRKGYENIRLLDAPGAWIDHYLYPNILDVPDEYKSKWIESEPIENWKDEWKPYMSTYQLEKLEVYIRNKNINNNNINIDTEKKLK